MTLVEACKNNAIPFKVQSRDKKWQSFTIEDDEGEFLKVRFDSGNIGYVKKDCPNIDDYEIIS